VDIWHGGKNKNPRLTRPPVGRPRPSAAASFIQHSEQQRFAVPLKQIEFCSHFFDTLNLIFNILNFKWKFYKWL